MKCAIITLDYKKISLYQGDNFVFVLQTLTVTNLILDGWNEQLPKISHIWTHNFKMYIALQQIWFHWQLTSVWQSLNSSGKQIFLCVTNLSANSTCLPKAHSAILSVIFPLVVRWASDIVDINFLGNNVTTHLLEATFIS